MKQYLGELMVGVGTALATWLFARRKRRNDFVAELQNSINLLAAENAKILKELIEVNTQNARSIYELSELKVENITLKKRVQQLNKVKSKQINVKTIKNR